MKRIWIDLLNPSHPLFFKPVVEELSKTNQIVTTMRQRGETLVLAEKLGFKGKAIGKDYEKPLQKTFSILARTIQLFTYAPKYDIAFSFENPMSVVSSKLRFKRSILMLDNDLKYKIKGNLIQALESKFKTGASHIIVPKACESTFEPHIKRSKLLTYNGYKEDVYIADFEPDPGFKDTIPFDDYFVIRPEALASFYVQGKGSLVPELLKQFIKEDLNVVLLPRDRGDKKYIQDSKKVYIPKDALNGLDLIYHSKGVLTGSGTMAREAAVMGRKAVSFFPNETLLSVDQDLIDKKRMIHSRDIREIMDHILSSSNNIKNRDSKSVKSDVMKILHEIIEN